MPHPKILLVLGGARSGKSRYAQQRAEAGDRELIFLATAQAFDSEMTDRIARHRDDRGARWTTVEEPLDLAQAIRTHDAENRLFLIDCLTLWASNMLLAESDHEAGLQALLTAMQRAKADFILVANEVGLGIVPDNALARAFRDLAGTINQRIAAIADEVILTVAAIPMTVKAAH